jgi:hypothetical protein
MANRVPVSSVISLTYSMRRPRNEATRSTPQGSLPWVAQVGRDLLAGPVDGDHGQAGQEP